MNNYLYNLLAMKTSAIEVKAVLIHMIRQFQIFTPQKCEEIKMVYGVSAAPDPQLLLSFKPRSQC
jgi:hypothetical protein